MTDEMPECDWAKCASDARWAVCNMGGVDAPEPVVRWHACGRHLNGVLAIGRWEADHVRVYDLTEPVGGS